MKILALAAASVVAGLSTTASAQTYYDRPYDRPAYDNRAYYADRDPRVVDARPQECYNPRAGHFEMVRPGEVQGDLDFGNCRLVGYRDDRAYRERREWREARQECWNPRAGHFEMVRPGDEQNDLDFNRCRILRG
jgi:hypothetical protein